MPLIPNATSGEALSGAISSLEESLCGYTGATFATAVESIKRGFLMALLTIGIEPGDSVMCSALAGKHVLESIASIGALPVLIDINPNTYLMDPFCIEYVVGKCIRTDIPLPKAVVCTNLFGMPCAYDMIEPIAERYQITLVEDASCSLGAQYAGRMSGTFGRVSVVGITGDAGEALGEDGAVLCKDPEDAKILRRLTGLGSFPDFFPGPDSDSQYVSAQLLLKKLETTQELCIGRQKAAQLYREGILPPLRCQVQSKEATSSWTRFVLTLPEGSDREKVIEALNREQVPVAVPLEPPPNVAMGSAGSTVLSNAQPICARMLELPLHAYLTPSVVANICDKINKLATTDVAQIPSSS